MPEIGSRDWFQTTQSSSYFKQLSLEALNAFNSNFTLSTHSTVINEARVMVQSAYDAYQTVHKNRHVRSTVLYRLDDRNHIVELISGGDKKFNPYILEFTSEIELFPFMFDAKPDLLEIKNHIIKESCLNKMTFWKELDTNTKSALLDSLLEKYEIFGSNGMHIAQGFLSEAVHQNSKLTKFYKLNKTTLELKAQGSLYAPLPKHSLPANVAWMLANIHQGRQLVICSEVNMQSILSSRRKITSGERVSTTQEVDALTGFAIEIALALAVGYSLRKTDEGVRLIPPADLTASQSVTFQALNFDFNEEKVRDKVIASCEWVGLQQRKLTESSEVTPPSDILLVLPARAALATESSVTSTTITSITNDASLSNALTVPPPSYATLTSSSSKRAKHPLLKEEERRRRVLAKEATPVSEEEAEPSDSQSKEGRPDNSPSYS